MNYSLGPVVVGIAVCVLCILFILFVVNIVSTWHVETDKICIWYLRMLHVTSSSIVVVLLMKHIKFSTSLTTCRWLNWIYFLGDALARILIYLLWENQHRMVSNALRQDDESSLYDPFQLITKLLVALPILNLTLNLTFVETGHLGNDQFSCLASTKNWVADTTMSLNLAVHIIFTGLFLRHLTMIRGTVNRLADSLGCRWNGTELALTAAPICSTARRFAIRRAVVSSIDTLWLILIFAFLNRLQVTKHDVYTERIMRMLHQLSNNVLQYFILFNRLANLFFRNRCSPEERSLQVDTASVHTGMLSKSIPAISRQDADLSRCLTMSNNDSDSWADVRRVFMAYKTSTVRDSFLDSEINELTDSKQ